MKKKGVGQNKNFGPIQKVSVPDFHHINHVFEQMQNDILEKPANARKQMKPFTIRKATQPNRGQPARESSQESLLKQYYATAPGERERSQERQPMAVGSMSQIAHDEELGDLTKEEAEALAPQDLKVINPWIHEQTHQEYLKKITGLPARHANVIKVHRQVVKETTFLPEDNSKVDKDKATRQALAILEKEYEIFSDPSLLPVKALQRYDTWDRDLTPHQWLDHCKKRPMEPHAVSPSFEKGEYTWKQVQVLGYDEKERKFKVRVMHNRQEKMVTRLSLLFYAEDPELFKERVELCKLRQKHVEQELRFTDLVDSIPADAVSILSKERREMFSSRSWDFIKNKFDAKSSNFDPDKVSEQLKKLNQVVMEEYIRQMKKCIVLKEMQDPQNFSKFAKLKVPVRVNKKTNPYFGVVRCPKYEFAAYQSEILRLHWCSKKEVADMTWVLANKCIEFQQHRFMQTNKKTLKLPLELDTLKKIQDSHHQAIKQNIKLQWREYLLGEMNKNLNQKYNFYAFEDIRFYDKSELKNIIVRFEQILNSFLREFAHSSIDDWVAFIKSYTSPKYDKSELWGINKEPMITVNLDIRKAKSDKKKRSKKKEGDAAAPAEELEDMSTIIYNPSLEACEDYMLSCIDQIVASNNEFLTLEAELFRFLKMDERINFEIPKEEEELKRRDLYWIIEAKQAISKMLKENMIAPCALLDQYKKFEFVLNVDRKELIDSLFNVPDAPYNKVPLEAIKEEITRFHEAEEEILNISNNLNDFPMFRVKAAKLKNSLAGQARKLKKRICERTYEWCTSSVARIDETFTSMEQRIKKTPQDEQELVDIKAFIDVSKNQTKEQLMSLLLQINKHMQMLDEFSEAFGEEGLAREDQFKCKAGDVETMYWLYRWPLQIDATIADGQQAMDAKTEDFTQTLDLQKDQFQKDLVEWQDKFKKIQKFTSIDKVTEFANIQKQLSEKISKGLDTVETFNRRERLFNTKESSWPALEELNIAFKPFGELIQLTFDVLQSLKDWTTTPLMSATPYEEMESTVSNNILTLSNLFKKLNDEHDEVAQVAIVVRGKLEEFREELPMIKYITSEAIQNEDWIAIKELVGKQEFEREQITVKQFTEENLKQYIIEIEEIVFRAEKKHQLTRKLKKLKEEMKDVSIQTFRHEKANPPAYILKGYDDINTVLDDQILQGQAMQASSYMKGTLKRDTIAWNLKLDTMQKIIDEMSKCQRTWMNLEPVFSSDDIEKTLPVETVKFREVDKLWRETTDQINDDPSILELTERENLLNSFVHANNQLEIIQRALNEYLEKKSLVFPRFFFLDSESLLMLLAQTKDPKAVQPHMDKLFEGISRVRFTEREEVSDMISAEQEEVPLIRKVDVNEGSKKGNVEEWMKEIEFVMIATIRKLTKEANIDYQKTDMEQWVSKWPGQIVLAVDQINWTLGVEKAFGKRDLNNFKEHMNQDINRIVKMVRGQLLPMLRVTLKALVVLQVHGRTVVEEMIDQKVTDMSDFKWSSQLRYYWEDKDMLRVKMVTAVIDYGFEYLGNSPRLVITPLTDRCYRTLMGAKNLQYGGAPEGPAGTGKTETVKDLAKALAVQCVVFNCQDGLDHNAMAKFFKGLAASGAWCCFDEFNRIDLEVLSVIAQQILTIQNAIKSRAKNFFFEGTTLNINPYCAVNITMNPGYAGRAELPDNLKALFRPCAMMVPDYTLIATIELYSFGFENARQIAVKITASLTLSSEQLSSQDHYDFGMRALKAILTACGNLRRKLEDWEEDKLGLRALNDVNKPKFTQNDVELYSGITSDLFPKVTLPTPDYSSLMNAMQAQCQLTNLQPKPIFLQKCIELYETLTVRHGLMVVGGAFSGKSKVINILKRSMASIQDDPNFEHNVYDFFINPKSILQEQLYGKFDADTGEWSDGVLAITIRNCAESTTPDRKWIIFDGPVDAVWIENMNTVLDDNKKLCLSSGQIIKLKPTMNLMFEVEDLSQASPATVSRCGMVLLEVHSLGHNVLIDSYCQKLSNFVNEKYVNKLNDVLHYCSNVICEYIRLNCKQCVTTGPNFLVNNMLHMLDTFVQGWDEVVEGKFSGEDAPVVYKTPKDAEEVLNNALLYALIWGIGAQVEETTRFKFDKLLQAILLQEPVAAQFNLDIEDPEPRKISVRLPDFQSIFDLSFQPEQMQWVNWLKTVPEYQVDPNCSFAQIVVPTLDSIRINNNLNRLLNAGKHTLIVGPTGTGKSISVMQELKQNFQNEKYNYISLAFSAQTSANQTQNIIDGRMNRRKKGCFGPPPGQQYIIFVDDLNMPRREKWGAQPPIELLRQWMDYGGWYDIIGEKEFKFIQDVKFCAAMGPPGISGNPITNRYVRHYNILYIEPYSGASQQQIFSQVMDWMFGRETKQPWAQGVKGLKDSIVQATIVTYSEIQSRFKPTPAKSHYTYNLRDVSKVFQGISKSDARALTKEEDIIKLWSHEFQRVFSDRLISQQDRDDFMVMLKTKVKERFKKDYEKIVEIKPLLFASFVPTLFREDDMEKKKPMADIYCELTNRAAMQKKAEGSLDEFNTINRQKKMDLVLFTDAIEHIVKIHRVITTQYGNALLVGVGGSGRKSLTELANFIAGYEIVTLEMAKGYDMGAWREDMAQKLFLACGCEKELKPLVFLFSDTQIIYESFLEDINNILNNGKIPNLYTKEDETTILDSLKEAYKGDPDFKEIQDDQAKLFEVFERQARDSLHVVLTMSPIGDAFKTRMRMFPALVNCCTIDWFLPWPKDALQAVAEYFLTSVDDLPNREGIVTICVDMQERAMKLTNRYRDELRRFYYVTPTSYLILIKTFTTLLNKRRKQVNDEINKFERGLFQLGNAEKSVGELRQNLEILIPQCKQAAEESQEKQKEIEIQRKEVEKEKKAAGEQAALAKEEKDKATLIKEDCDKALDKVMPIYNKAMKAVAQLKSSDVTEMKGTKSPSAGLLLVAQVLCLIFNVKPKVIRAQTAKEVDKMDYWEPTLKTLLKPELLKMMQTYDKDNVPAELVISLKPILESPDYTEEKMAKTSQAALGISNWTKAIVQYDEAMKVVKPKQQELKEAEEASAKAQASLDIAQENLARVEANFAKLIAELDAAKAFEQSKRQEKEDKEYKLDLANNLINKLGSERDNWVIQLAQRKNDRECLVGDTLVCSGFLAYLGVFIASYRAICTSEWINMLKMFSITCSEKLDIVNILGNPVRIAEWTRYGLPQDSFSTENAIIWENSDRWCLMIDPQMQANQWLVKLSNAKCGKESVKIIKPTTEQKLMSRIIENAMSLGYVIILEDANETFDPMLDPLLAKQLKKQGSEWMIKFGDGLKTYSLDFKFYITTKISRPHYSPEICVKVSMINFMVTPEGLLDQITSVILQIEEQKKYEMREKTIAQTAEADRQKKELQDKILDQIAKTSDDILEDKELKASLEDSQATMQQIMVLIEQSTKTMKNINQFRDDCKHVSLRVSRMFFVLTELININEMYQYSLDFFVNIFQQVLLEARSQESVPKKEKYDHFKNEFLERLFKQVSWSLFENHKLLFSFLLTLKILDENLEKQGGVPTAELRFMMAGSTKVQATNPNPTGANGWLSEKAWCAIEEMTELFPQSFPTFDKNFARDIKQWEKFYDSQNPHQFEPWPYKLTGDLELIRKTMIMRILRPDKVTQMIIKIVESLPETRKFVSPPAFDIAELYSNSKNKAPIILVISPGADPMSEIQKFSSQRKIKVDSLSLGKGQDEKAKRAIKDAENMKSENGTEGIWVVLQNCHLCPSFMPMLDALINEVKPNTESSFRIWLTTMPSNAFPVTIVQNGLKATSEPPKGLQANITKSFRTLVTDKDFDNAQPAVFKKLVYALCFFNAVIIERRKFGPLGWNVRYQFSVPDLEISKLQLIQFLNHYEGIPFEALRYMVAEANYGGRVTDIHDRRTITTILTDYYNENVVNQDMHRLCGSEHYQVPNAEDINKRDDFLNYIDKHVPFEDKTEIFGMHDNAEITSAINFTNELLTAALTQQPRTATAGGQSSDQILDDTATQILAKLPNLFDTEEAAKKHPLSAEKSMNTVLQQEILRFNRLLKLVRDSLKQLKQAIKGEVMMSPELELVASSIFDNKIPEMWMKRSYPSLKPLASYVVDFANRLKFIQDWINNNAPAVFWISGFYFTQSFLTGLKQDFARKYGIAIDKIDFTFQVISDESKFNLKKSAPDGAYIDGLFIEGCRWDERLGVLTESQPKVLLTKMPKMWFVPKNIDQIEHGHAYQCPLYKTLERFGTLSTTGHSTNFVVEVMLPMQQKHTESHWIKRGVAMVTQDND